MLDPYRSVDIFPEKYGVNTIIDGFLWKFKPWYFDGKTVWWGKDYELRSEAEDAAMGLKERMSS